MTARVRRLIVVVVALLAVACHVPTTIQTPQGRIAYSADQVVVRVNELMNAAIDAEATGALRTADARLVVEWAVAADRVLAATPAGWQATIRQAWATLRAALPRQSDPAVVAAMGLVDAVLASLEEP